jgi:imidazoleglycerol-phosphate dehydratase
MPERQSRVTRKTRETEVNLSLNLDGKGKAEIATGIGFLDHMLELLTRHALFDLSVKAAGDLKVDEHHTTEDVGICLGQALDQALGSRKGIARFGAASCPMDEALAQVSVDISGRPFLVLNLPECRPQSGGFSFSLLREFLHALATHARIALHVNVPYGSDPHHIWEAIFKAAARALSEATSLRAGETGVPSTKGVL